LIFHNQFDDTGNGRRDLPGNDRDQRCRRGLPAGGLLPQAIDLLELPLFVVLGEVRPDGVDDQLLNVMTLQTIGKLYELCADFAFA
jgi:hypothetical protein